MATKKIILVRHGSTRDNGQGAKDKIRGWSNAPLDDRGVIDAQRAAKELKGLPITLLASSDLQRAVQTAGIIQKVTGIQMATPSQFFRPWNLGVYTGMESEKAHPVIQQMATEHPDQPVQGGESFHSFERRFMHGLKLLCMHEGLPALVTHYRCICLLEAWKDNGFQPDGSINHGRFCVKGEPPGHVKEFDVPVERIPR